MPMDLTYMLKGVFFPSNLEGKSNDCNPHWTGFPVCILSDLLHVKHQACSL